MVRRGFIVVLLLPLLLICGGCDFIMEQFVGGAVPDADLLADTPLIEPGQTIHVTRHWNQLRTLGRCRFLRDPNKLHISAGKAVGLNPHFRKNADFLADRDSLLECGALVYVPDTIGYRKKSAKYSYPYLTPEAYNVLNELSDRFQQKLKARRQPAYSLYLTSCLRTEESQIRLRKGNKNATKDTTSHLYGASFDISYWEFVRNSTGRASSYKHIQNILAKTISEMREEKKFLVIKENGQFCFHITVIQ